jgi:hypothetical protein
MPLKRGSTSSSQLIRVLLMCMPYAVSAVSACHAVQCLLSCRGLVPADVVCTWAEDMCPEDVVEMEYLLPLVTRNGSAWWQRWNYVASCSTASTGCWQVYFGSQCQQQCPASCYSSAIHLLHFGGAWSILFAHGPVVQS